MEIAFDAEVWFWRGPSPYHFATVPAEQSELLAEVAPMVSYGWGMVPVTAHLGGTTWTTSLFPKDGGYVLPFKDAVRRAEGVAVGDRVAVRLIVEG